MSICTLCFRRGHRASKCPQRNGARAMIDRIALSLAITVAAMTSGAALYFATSDLIGAAEAITLFARAGL